MSSSVTTALAVVFFAVSSASFTLPRAPINPRVLGESSFSGRHVNDELLIFSSVKKSKPSTCFFLALDTKNVDRATSEEATSYTITASSCDPADVFTSDLGFHVAAGPDTDLLTPKIARSLDDSSSSSEEEHHPSLDHYIDRDHRHQEQKSVDDVIQDQCVDDIIRDLDGNPLAKEYLARKMGIPVEFYTCPEKGAFRGHMSNGCRIRLYSPGGETKTAFYKRVAFAQLDHARTKLKKEPFKLYRDIQSYLVVDAFLSSKACRQLTAQTGVQIPKCFDSKLEPNYDNPIESKFSFLLQDFAPSDGWYQQWLLSDQEECEAALATFAKIHAFFWNGSSFWSNDNVDAARELEAGVWKSGSYVQPTAQKGNQCQKVAREWAIKRMKFEKYLSSLNFWDNLGERLQSVAEECGRLAHPFAEENDLCERYKKYRTFTHGDPKSANLLFRRTSSNSKLQVGLIDFQWSGFGLAATDVAHFLTSAIHSDRLINGGEETLLRYYFDELQKYLVEFGAFRSETDAVQHFSYDTFINQYETGILDIVRLVVAYTWSRFDEPVEKDDKAGCARTMNKTSYNKSIPNAVWLMSRCDEILRSREV